MRVALFMGAGASKAFDMPLTAELLPIIRSRLRAGTLFERSAKPEQAAEQRAELDRLLRCLLPGFGDAGDDDLPLITEVMSLVDFSTQAEISVVPALRRGVSSRLRRTLQHAIYEALDWEEPYETEPPGLAKISDWLEDAFRKADPYVGLISTNYDTLIESRLVDRFTVPEILEGVDFGFEARQPGSGRLSPRPARPRFALFKLHGALNWLRCPNCDRSYVNFEWAIMRHGFRAEDDIDDANTCHCNYAPLEAVMVAPSTVRDIRDSNLLEVWRHSLEFLRLADEWIIVGYSFPPEDLAVRSMFTRAYNARSRKPSVTVIQKGTDLRTLKRYRVMFPDCRYSTDGVEWFADALPDYHDKVESLPLIGPLLRDAAGGRG